MLPIVPNDDMVFAKPARNRHIVIDRHQIDNHFVESVNCILEHTPQRNLFGEDGHENFGGMGVGDALMGQELGFRRMGGGVAVSVF